MGRQGFLISIALRIKPKVIFCRTNAVAKLQTTVVPRMRESTIPAIAVSLLRVGGIAIKSKLPSAIL